MLFIRWSGIGGPSTARRFFIVVFSISVFSRGGLTLILQGFGLCLEYQVKKRVDIPSC